MWADLQSAKITKFDSIAVPARTRAPMSSSGPSDDDDDETPLLRACRPPHSLLALLEALDALPHPTALLDSMDDDGRSPLSLVCEGGWDASTGARPV